MEVELWHPGHERSIVVAPSAGEIVSAITSVRDAESATVGFGDDGEDAEDAEIVEADLIIGVSRGYYTAVAMNGDDWMVLVGDPGAVGEVELNLGGQPAGHSRRQLIGEEDAIAVALELVVTGELDFSRRGWESPG